MGFFRTGVPSPRHHSSHSSASLLHNGASLSYTNVGGGRRRRHVLAGDDADDYDVSSTDDGRPRDLAVPAIGEGTNYFFKTYLDRVSHLVKTLFFNVALFSN